MANAKPLGQVADCRPAVRGKPLDRQQRLVLTRRQPGAAGRRLAKFQKSANQVTKLSQQAITLEVEFSNLPTRFPRNRIDNERSS